MPIVSYPIAATTPAATARMAVAAVVAMAFDADGVTTQTSGRLTVAGVEVQGAGVVVLTLPGLNGGAATFVGDVAAAVRVQADVVLLTFAAGVPTAGAATLLLADRVRGGATRAQNTLAPAPPAAFVYAERTGDTGALAMTLDARTAAVRIEALDLKPRVLTTDWQPLRTTDAAPGPLTLPLLTHEDVPGRRFRAVALRTVSGDTIDSSPSAETYRNRAPISAGERTIALPVGLTDARVSLLTLVSDPDGGPMTYRTVVEHDVFSRQARPAWMRVDGSDLVVQTAGPHDATTVAIVGVDERGASASAEITLSVYVPTGPDAPGVVEYVL